MTSSNSAGDLLLRLLPTAARADLATGVAMDYVRLLYPMSRTEVDAGIFDLLLPLDRLFPGGNHDRVYVERFLGRVRHEEIEILGQFNNLTILFAACGRKSSTTVAELADRLGPGASQVATRGRGRNGLNGNSLMSKAEVGTLVDMVSITACMLTVGQAKLTPDAQTQAWKVCAGVTNLLIWSEKQQHIPV